MNFQTLAIVLAAGMCGPLMSSGRRGLIPVIVGELAAGAALGEGGLKVLHPSDPTFAFLANGGFVMMMFAAGMHVPVRSMARSFAGGMAGTAICTILAVTAGVGVHAAFGGPALVYALLMANSSAAVLVPLVQERGLDQARLARTLAQVSIADTLTIVLLPMVLQPSQVRQAALGVLYVLAALAALALLVWTLRGRFWVERLRKLSREREWALELRVSLIAVFVLAAVAQAAGISLMIAGFAAGLLLSWLGGRKRLDRQVLAVAQGFFVPIFFVSLGAKLNVVAAFSRPPLLGLTGALIVSAGVVHILTGALTREGKTAGLLTVAQLGLPAAAVNLGLKAHLIGSGQAAAIMLAGLGTIALSAVASARLVTRQAVEQVHAERAVSTDPPADTVEVTWRRAPAVREFDAAEQYLSLVLSEPQVRAAMRQLRHARGTSSWTAREILHQAGLQPLGAGNIGVAKKLARALKGKPLSPVMLVLRDDGPAIVADGYHRTSTVFLVDERTTVPVLQARI